MIRLCDRICSHYDLAAGSCLIREGQVTQETLPFGRHNFGDGGLAIAYVLELRGVHIVDLELDPLLFLKEVVQCEGFDKVRIQVVQHHLGLPQQCVRTLFPGLYIYVHLGVADRECVQIL